MTSVRMVKRTLNHVMEKLKSERVEDENDLSKDVTLNSKSASETLEEPLKCLSCGRGFSQSADLNRHMTVMHVKKEPESFNNNQESINGRVNNEQRIKIEPPTEENNVVKSTINRRKKISVIKVKLDVNERSQDLPFSCSVCKRMFSSQRGLSQHEREHRFQKSHMTTRTQSIYLYVDEAVCNPKVPFQCLQCDKSFENTRDAEIHMRSAHVARDSDDVVSQKNSNQEDSNEVENTRDLVNSPVNQQDVTGHVKSTKRRRENVSIAQVARTNCAPPRKICSTPLYKEPLSSPKSMKVNIKSDDCAKPFQCKLCKKRFTREDGLTVHMKVNCRGKEPLLCEVCKKPFVTKGELRKHMAVMHRGARPLKCTRCKMEFKLSSDLEKHMKMKHSTRPKKQLECDICKKMYRQEKSLHQHILRDHVTGKKHQCPICEKICGGRQGLMSHIRVHDHSKRETTSVSDDRVDLTRDTETETESAVESESDIESHIDSEFESAIDMSSDGDLVTEPIIMNDVNEKPFVCFVCQECFESQEEVEDHLKVHT